MRAAGAVRGAAFVLRCAGAAVASWMLATWLGFDRPLWAVVASLIVSQDRLDDTRRSVRQLLVATATGVVVALVVGTVLTGADTPVLLGVSVAICAALSRWHGELRLGMWTTAIVLLTVAPGQSLADTACARGIEVLIGGVVGAALHQLAEAVVGAVTRRRATR